MKSEKKAMTTELIAPPPVLNGNKSVFLDFDGTLTKAAPTRDEVYLSREVADVLTKLQSKLGGRLALLSGRDAFDVRKRIGLDDVAIGGSGRGLGFTNRGVEAHNRPLGLEIAARQLRRLNAECSDISVDERPGAITLHYRRAPELAPICRQIMERLATATGLLLENQKDHVGLRAATTDKGRSVRLFMRQRPFRGSAPVVVADDITDEHAFVVARELGGFGVLVGPSRKTAASYRLPSVDAVHNWLRGLAGLDRSHWN